MRKNLKLFCFLLLFCLTSITMTACGNLSSLLSGQTPTATPMGVRVAAKAENVDHAPLAKTQTTPTVTTEPQSTPTPLVIDWNTAVATIYTLGAANIRDTPFTSGAILDTVDAGQSLTSYGTVDGEILSAGAVWYRVSAQDSAPQYIYSDLVSTTKPVQVDTSVGAGKVIKVNLTTQHIDAYDNGTIVHDNLITSGQPGLMTPTGTFQIISKLHPTVFTSPWPVGSPYYYAPLNIDYALGFQGTLLFLHDATWRGTDFGPGTQVPHTGTDGSQMTGSHGCVEMATANSEWFYNWTPIGTPLIISY
jgi:lipoprotein-anchoring transpeptidase ErfK/SrfK